LSDPDVTLALNTWKVAQKERKILEIFLALGRPRGYGEKYVESAKKQKNCP
jgi:hypothetical protein